jgi:hypothetical protein
MKAQNVLVPTALDNGQLEPKHWLGRIVRRLTRR